jgi:hypothetical protein
MTRPMARKIRPRRSTLRQMTIIARVSISEAKLLRGWANADRVSKATIMRELIERERRRREMLAIQEAAQDLPARARAA